MYKIKVNDRYQFELSETSGKISNNGIEVEPDIQALGDNSFHIIYQNKSYRAEVIELRKQDKVILTRINGREYLVELRDKYDDLLQQLGFDKAASSQLSELKAPMPGLVLQVLVKEGEHVTKGSTLLILEAMKMENIIKSSVDGTIKQVMISVGDKVDKNQVMIKF